MSDRKLSKRRSGKRGDKAGSDTNDDIKLNKADQAVAKYVRFNCPTQTTMFEGNEVHYFSARKAVDTLVNSKKYGAGSKKSRFSTDEDAQQFLSSLLARGLFFRAKKLVLKKKGDKEKENFNKKTVSSKVKKGQDDKQLSPTKAQRGSTETTRNSHSQCMDEDAGDDENDAPGFAEAKNEESGQIIYPDGDEAAADDSIEFEDEQDKPRKKKKKVKLIFQEHQHFVLSTADVYVWVYDPTPLYKQCIGVLIVLGTILGCIYPLWPMWLRLTVYYASLTGIGLFFLLIAVALIRTAIFGLIWCCTFGRHHLWILPNLTEDCGFFDSFKPFYTYEYVPPNPSSSTDKNGKEENTNSKEDTQESEEYNKNEHGGGKIGSQDEDNNTGEAGSSKAINTNQSEDISTSRCLKGGTDFLYSHPIESVATQKQVLSDKPTSASSSNSSSSSSDSSSPTSVSSSSESDSDIESNASVDRSKKKDPIVESNPSTDNNRSSINAGDYHLLIPTILQDTNSKTSVPTSLNDSLNVKNDSSKQILRKDDPIAGIGAVDDDAEGEDTFSTSSGSNGFEMVDVSSSPSGGRSSAENNAVGSGDCEESTNKSIGAFSSTVLHSDESAGK